VDISVRNLDFSTTQEQLRAAFAVHGSVASVSIATDRFTDQYRGLASIQMGNNEEAESAIRALNGKLVGGRRLAVDQLCPAKHYGPARHIEDRRWKRRV